MRRGWLQLLALTVATLLALPVQAFARAAYVCQMSGRVSHHACCCSSRAAAEPALGPSIARQDCCEPLVKGEGAPVAATQVDAQNLQAMALAHDDALELPRLARGELLARPCLDDAPTRGPPLFLAHCALLL